MAGVLKHWRESASLIIASKKLSMPQPRQTLLNRIMRKQPELVENTHDEIFRVLLLKRSAASSNLPKVHVFPGGMLDNNDFSKEWLDLTGCNGDLLQLLARGFAGAPIFSRKRAAEFSEIPSEIALRIAAIRETFEESGILLARPIDDVETLKLNSLKSHPICSTYCNMSSRVNIEWRKQIISDPSQFLVMCKELKMVPDIWSLYEWSNWLTPLLRGSRFDTAFFICCVDEAPLIYDSEETEEGIWLSPSGILKACSQGIVPLAPPQLYELSRLTQFNTTDDLLSLSWKRSAYRAKRWMPVLVQCQDCTMIVLPGDDMYPENPDLTGEIGSGATEVSQSFQELQNLYPRQNRIVVNENKQLSLYCNVKFVSGHMLPLEFNKEALSK
ncbi:unnamed protein product [Lymnaea stagnalis]|uniref:Nudix hydrolase domain-containing protein n=1 Tax=Lymnaea stagnalis TaxID=6523 RepID=A0AAV2HES8_LYMST